MSTEKAELLQSQMNANAAINSNSSNEKLIERAQIEGTPFWTIKQNGQYTIVMGRYKINHIELTNEEDIETFLREEMYNIISTMIFVIQNEAANKSNI